MIFTESYDSDSDNNFHKRRNNFWGKRNKKGTADPQNKNKYEADEKKSRNRSDVNGEGNN